MLVLWLGKSAACVCGLLALAQALGQKRLRQITVYEYALAGIYPVYAASSVAGTKS
jgi:hypothetical protein